MFYKGISALLLPTLRIELIYCTKLFLIGCNIFFQQAELISEIERIKPPMVYERHLHYLDFSRWVLLRNLYHSHVCSHCPWMEVWKYWRIFYIEVHFLIWKKRCSSYAILLELKGYYAKTKHQRHGETASVLTIVMSCIDIYIYLYQVSHLGCNDQYCLLTTCLDRCSFIFRQLRLHDT